jgi:hypothetical protein
VSTGYINKIVWWLRCAQREDTYHCFSEYNFVAMIHDVVVILKKPAPQLCLICCPGSPMSVESVMLGSEWKLFLYYFIGLKKI